jgi:hypothetical protein
LTLKLQGLDPNAQYELENLDGGNIEKLSGKALMDTGLTVTLKECSSAALFIYRKAK